jgi:hypothetical protein
MQQRKALRDKKEVAKRQELLLKGGSNEITQEAADARAKETKKVDHSQKMLMKKKQREARPDAPSKTKPSKTKKNDKKKNAVVATTALPDKATGTTQRKKQKLAEPQGVRKIPEPGDKHGCKHHGLLELIALPKTYLKAYMADGGWLHNKPCKDCAENKGNQEERVLDVSTLLKLKGKNDVGYYCNSGPTGHKMDMDDEKKKHFTCDTILCMACYDRRKATMESDGGATRTRRKKRRD